VTSAASFPQPRTTNKQRSHFASRMSHVRKSSSARANGAAFGALGFLLAGKRATVFSAWTLSRRQGDRHTDGLKVGDLLPTMITCLESAARLDRDAPHRERKKQDCLDEFYTRRRNWSRGRRSDRINQCDGVSIVVLSSRFRNPPEAWCPARALAAERRIRSAPHQRSKTQSPIHAEKSSPCPIR